MWCSAQYPGGPANRSFGLQVAKLAGIPAAVLNAAQDKLRELEQGCPSADSARRPRLSPAQVDLFSEAPPPVVNALEELQPGRADARQALDLLYRMKSQLD